MPISRPSPTGRPTPTSSAGAPAALAAGVDRAIVTQAARLRGRLRMPADKSISHRALLLAAVAEGTSRLSGVSTGADPEATAACLSALGVDLRRGSGSDEGRAVGTDEGRVEWTVRSPGWAGWRAPQGELDCANSGTTMRLLAGLLAGSAVAAPVLISGDTSLRRRPMDRIVGPLTAMGADIRALGEAGRPPLTVAGRRPLRAVAWATPVPSAQVKSAVLLAGLAGEGRTTVREAVATRDHTERMLRARGVAVDAGPDDEGGWRVAVEGGQRVRTRDERIPGDLSAAAFWLVAGAAHPDAELTLEGVGVNPSRAALIELLAAMGAAIEVRRIEVGEAGEPTADLVVRSSALWAIEIGPAEVARAIDEIPVLCLAAACARGITRVRGAGELRHKESDRLTAIVTGLQAFGARIELDGDDLAIEGRPDRLGLGLEGAEVASLGDHRLAMTFAVAGLIAPGRTVIHGSSCVNVSYPGFFGHLEGVRA